MVAHVLMRQTDTTERMDLKMNKQRRRALDEVHSKLMTIVDELERAQRELSDIKDEEQDALWNMPDSLQESERGQRIDEIVGILDEADCTIDEARSNIEEAMGNLWDIIEEFGYPIK